MIKISNQDLANSLKELDGEPWTFGFGWSIQLQPCFYVIGKSVNDMENEYATQIPLKPIYKRPTAEKYIARDFFSLNWAEVYRNLIPAKIMKDGKLIDCKSYTYKNKDITFIINLPERVLQALENIMTKSPEKTEKPKEKMV